VCPLLGATGLFETFVGVPDTAENRKKFVTNVPLGRLCEASDVADACLFLASEEARFVTGTCLEIDGGKGIS
jgi:NAD(P)-dependent dehydrogenase (short-subunit alcohol dehydrogenase family)